LVNWLIDLWLVGCLIDLWFVGSLVGRLVDGWLIDWHQTNNQSADWLMAGWLIGIKQPIG